METIRTNYLISHCYASTKVRENKDGSKSTHVFHIVFKVDLPAGPNVKVRNVISQTEKQVRYLATIARLPNNLPLPVTLQQLAGAIGNSRTLAVVSSEKHMKGSDYIDKDNVKQQYTEDSVANKIDSLVLAKSLVEKVDAKLAEIMVGVYESADPFADVAKIDEKSEPEL